MLDRPARQKLSALDLARRVGAGELTPRVVDLRTAIAARETRSARSRISISTARASTRRTPAAQRRSAARSRRSKHLYSRCRPNMACRLQGKSASGRRRRGLDGAPRRRTDPRQDRHHRIRPHAAGKTHNPVNPAHTPGGSSSGSAAAVAAGMADRDRRRPAAGDPPGGLLRHRGIQAVLQAATDHRDEMLLMVARSVGLFAAGVADVAFATARSGTRSASIARHRRHASRSRTHIFAEASPACRTPSSRRRRRSRRRARA